MRIFYTKVLESTGEHLMLLKRLGFPSFCKPFNFHKQCFLFGDNAAFQNERLAHIPHHNDIGITRLFNGSFIINMMLDANSKVFVAVKRIKQVFGFLKPFVVWHHVSNLFNFIQRIMMKRNNGMQAARKHGIHVIAVNPINRGLVLGCLSSLKNGRYSNDNTQNNSQRRNSLPVDTANQSLVGGTQPQSPSKHNMFVTSNYMPTLYAKSYSCNLNGNSKTSIAFDKQKVSGLTCGISAIVGVGFCSLFILVRVVTSLLGGFFYARSFSSSLYGGLGEGASARCFLGSSLQTSSNLPPVFCSSDGGNNYQGASL